jgi:hypothetical protein
LFIPRRFLFDTQCSTFDTQHHEAMPLPIATKATFYSQLQTTQLSIHMKTFIRYLTIIVLWLTLQLLIGCSHSPTGKYVSQTNPSDYLELRDDGTFFLNEMSAERTGKYRIDGKTITLEWGSGVAVRGTLDGKTLTDKDGDKWVKQEKPVAQKLPLPVLDDKLRTELLGYLKQNYRTPEDYVLSKFKDHQIVFIGELHRVKHDPELVQQLIPRLCQAGIYNLGIEFGTYRDQPKVDKLINMPVYDEQVARDIMFDWYSSWGFKEYMDIYRAAWEVNHKLPEGAPHFRVVNLNATMDWSFVKTAADRNNSEIMKKVWPEGDSDSFMAGVILKEFGDKNQKALIYSGMHHAFTRYKEPIVDHGKVIGFGEGRTGNLVYKKLGDRVFTICLHHPWTDSNWQAWVYPAEGVIDALLYNEPHLRPVGFDLAGTPFGDLGGKNSIYEKGYQPFSLKLFADGYIYIKPISQYQSVTADEKFITADNFKRAVEQLDDPEEKAGMTNINNMIEYINHSAEELPRRCVRLW